MFSVKQYANGRFKVGFESASGEVVDVLPQWYDDKAMAERAASRMTRTFSVVEVMSEMAPMVETEDDGGAE